ncbi:PREDICTED: protein PAXX [Aptenodytes forsteri]|uniref:protein PAXX n=1 Tax=Aptenodytes forsteri TaxID=9233 RepID=UPI000904E79B|nr:PREDICTED: protein PAXX [Aptenodytes forsteri]
MGPEDAGSRKILGQWQPGWECWEENVAQFGCGGEGASWGGLECCMLRWGVLSQALALVPVSAAVEMLTSSCSPEKNAVRSQQLFLPDPSPRKNRGAGSALPAKRKIPGESLINPGFKSKKAPSGVDFEDS